MCKFFCVIDTRGEVLSHVPEKTYFLFKRHLKGKLESYYKQDNVAVVGWFTEQQLEHQRVLIRELYEVHHYLIEMDFSYHPQGHYTHPDEPGEFSEYDALTLAEKWNGRFIPKYSNWRTRERRNPLDQVNRKHRQKWDKGE